MGSKRNGSTYIGTSGWSYKDWHGRFYPETLKKIFYRFTQKLSTLSRLTVPSIIFRSLRRSQNGSAKHPLGFSFP
jgi:hypothetical protein